MSQVVIEKDHNFSAYKVLAQVREGKDPAWLANLREKAGERFESLVFPTTRHEAWKYTNVAPILKVPYRQILDWGGKSVTAETISPFTFAESRRMQLVFINGLFSAQLSNLSELPPGVVVGNLGDGSTDQVKFISRHLAAYANYQEETFTALNTASINHGAFIYVPDGKAVAAPIHLLFLSSAKEPVISHPRVLIVAGKGAIATIIESYAALGATQDEVYFTNAVTEVVTQQDAVITHYRLQEESESAFHVATTQVLQERNSNYSSYSISLGGRIVRHTLNITLNDEHIETTIDGLYVVSGRQHVDNHTTIDHAHPHGTSHQTYKGILDGQSRAVFNGKVLVREGALLTDARQLNKNLLLSAEAHIDTKPELEIFADDVKCAHGATVGQLEEEELFYLASRGLGPERARALLTYGFAEDIIRKIKLSSVREQLDRIVLEKLHQNLEVN